MEDTQTFTLLKPVSLGNTEFTEITMVEPTMAQVETSMKEASQTSGNILLVALVAKIPPAAVRAMGLRDFNRAVKFLEGFTQAEEAAEEA